MNAIKNSFVDDVSRWAQASDFELGDTIRTNAILVTEEDICGYASQFDPQPMHTNRQAGEASFFKQLVGSGWHACALTMKLMVEAKMLGATPLIGVEVDRIRFEKPLLPGETLCAEAMVIGKKQTRSGRGFVTFALRTLGADESVVMSMQWTLMLPPKQNDG